MKSSVFSFVLKGQMLVECSLLTSFLSFPDWSHPFILCTLQMLYTCAYWKKTNIFFKNPELLQCVVSQDQDILFQSLQYSRQIRVFIMDKNSFSNPQFILKFHPGTSLVAHLLRLCTPTQGAWVWSLGTKIPHVVWGDPPPKKVHPLSFSLRASQVAQW